MQELGIDVRFLLAQLINFGLFTFIFMKFLYKPFKAYMADQHKEEAEKDRLLHELREKEDALAEKEKKIIAEARSQATQIIKDAEAAAGEKRQDILKKAQEEVAKMKKKAQQDIDDNKAKMYDELKSKVVKTSEAMTEAVLKDFLSKDHQKDILEQVFKKLQTTKVYEN